MAEEDLKLLILLFLLLSSGITYTNSVCAGLVYQCWEANPGQAPCQLNSMPSLHQLSESTDLCALFCAWQERSA